MLRLPCEHINLSILCEMHDIYIYSYVKYLLGNKKNNNIIKII